MWCTSLLAPGSSADGEGDLLPLLACVDTGAATTLLNLPGTLITGRGCRTAAFAGDAATLLNLFIIIIMSACQTKVINNYNLHIETRLTFGRIKLPPWNTSCLNRLGSFDSFTDSFWFEFFLACSDDRSVPASVYCIFLEIILFQFI